MLTNKMNNDLLHVMGCHLVRSTGSILHCPFHQWSLANDLFTVCLKCDLDKHDRNPIMESEFSPSIHTPA